MTVNKKNYEVVVQLDNVGDLHNIQNYTKVRNEALVALNTNKEQDVVGYSEQVLHLDKDNPSIVSYVLVGHYAK